MKPKSSTSAILLVLACAPALSAWAQYTAIKVPKGYVQLEGDIIVTEGDAQVLLGKSKDGSTNNNPNFVYAPSRLWPNRVVPYVFDSSVTANQQSTFLQAMSWWQASFPGFTTITFQACNDCQGGYLVLKVADPGFFGGNTDYVGYKASPVTITVHPDLWTNSPPTGLIAHELAHALGDWHEQSRDDRTNYITINTAAIQTGQSDQFDIKSPQSHFGDYDYDSIMHYSACSFSSCLDTNGKPNCTCPSTACDTILVASAYAAQQCNIGQRSHLSGMDKRAMAFMYGPGSWRFLWTSPGSTGAGNFQQPYTSFPQAYAGVPTNGVLWIGPGSFSTGGVPITTPMTIQAAVPDLKMQPDGSLGPSPSGWVTLQ